MPVNAATESFAVLGRRGSGKTHTAVVLVEEMHAAGVQVVIIDPIDVWWGLRVSRDGKSAGIPIYVFGGSHADVPLTADSGSMLADVVVSYGISVVLSLRHLSKANQRRFVEEFCDRLYDAKNDPSKRTALHLVIDEADVFVPQRLTPGTERCFGAVDTIIRRGRSSGLAPTLISQRPQVIHKDVLSQTEVLVCHQLSGPQDRKALEAWIEANDTEDKSAEFMESLASLPRGRAWFWSPGMLHIFKAVDVRDRHTFDSSSTPKPGVRVVKPRKFAQVDIERLSARITETIERAKADDPKALRRKIAELEAQLKQAKATPAPVSQQVVPNKLRTMLEDAEASIAALQASLPKHVASVISREAVKIAGMLDFAMKSIGAVAPTAKQIVAAVKAPQRIEIKKTDSKREVRPVALTALPKGLLKCLTVVAQYPQGASRAQLALLTGYTSASCTTYVGRLTARGLVEVGSDRLLRPTPLGVEALGDSFEPLPTGSALRDYWLNELPTGEAAVLRVLLEGYPGGVFLAEIAGATHYTPASCTTYLGRLTRRLLVERSGTAYRASDVLFDA